MFSYIGQKIKSVIHIHSYLLPGNSKKLDNILTLISSKLTMINCIVIIIIIFW